MGSTAWIVLYALVVLCASTSPIPREGRPEKSLTLTQAGKLEEAFAFLSKQQYKEAKTLVKQVYKETKTTNPLSSLNLLGLISRESKDLKNALKYFKRCLELQPGSATVHFNIAHVLLDQGKKKEAVVYLEKAVYSNPEPQIGERAAQLLKQLQGPKPTSDILGTHSSVAVAGAYENDLQAGLDKQRVAGHQLQKRLLKHAESSFNAAIEAFKRAQSSLVNAVHEREAVLRLGEVHFGLAEVLLDLGHKDQAFTELQHAEDYMCRFLDWFADFGIAYTLLGRIRLMQSRLREAASFFLLGFFMDRGRPWLLRRGSDGGRAGNPSRFDKIRYVLKPEGVISEYKLSHDVYQLKWLVDQGFIPRTEGMAAIEAIKQLRTDLPIHSLIAMDQLMPITQLRPVQHVLHKAFYLQQPGPWPSHKTALNPQINWSQVAASFEEHGAVFIDDFLDPSALTELWEICATSTIYNQVNQARIGAYLRDGFAPDVLLRMSEQLNENLRRIFNGHSLYNMWAYKYDSRVHEGFMLHTEISHITVNLWLTPDRANLNTSTGGMVIYKKATVAMHERQMNKEEWRRFRSFITQDELLRVEYKQNRAVIFLSALMHEGQPYDFDDRSFWNQRISVTLNFGHRGAAGLDKEMKRLGIEIATLGSLDESTA